MELLTYILIIIGLIIVGLYFLNQVRLAREIALKDTTLDTIEEKLKKHKLIVPLCKSTISETDLTFNGTITNLIPHVLNEASKIYIYGDIQSTYINLSE